MNRYRVTVTVTETRTCEEEVTFDVDAEDEEQARREARILAPDRVKFNSWDFDHEDTDTHVSAVEFISGEDPDGKMVTPRCDKTIDMFQGEQG